jgi:hypothetical protein
MQELRIVASQLSRDTFALQPAHSPTEQSLTRKSGLRVGNIVVASKKSTTSSPSMLYRVGVVPKNRMWVDIDKDYDDWYTVTYHWDGLTNFREFRHINGLKKYFAISTPLLTPHSRKLPYQSRNMALIVRGKESFIANLVGGSLS